MKSKSAENTRWIEYLMNWAQHHISHFIAASPCLLLLTLWSVFRYVLKVSSSVTSYPLNCTLAKNSCLGVYSGIFAIYLQCPSNESRTRSANVVFYILCILYVLCAATIVCDLLVFTFVVSNKFICNIILINSCAVPYYLSNIASTSNWLTAHIKSHCGCPTNSKCLLWLHRSMHHSTHKPFKFYLSSVYSPKSSKIYRCWIV